MQTEHIALDSLKSGADALVSTSIAVGRLIMMGAGAVGIGVAAKFPDTQPSLEGVDIFDSYLEELY